MLFIFLALAVVFGLPIAAGRLTDWWFESLNFADVFRARLMVHRTLFASGAGLFALVTEGE